MMLRLDTNGHTYRPEQAEKLAAEMNASDDWTYTVKHDPKGTGNSLVLIHDEDGEFVGNL